MDNNHNKKDITLEVAYIVGWWREGLKAPSEYFVKIKSNC